MVESKIEIGNLTEFANLKTVLTISKFGKWLFEPSNNNIFYYRSLAL